MTKKNISTNGFTLIEVLITTVITIILGGGILTLIFISTQNRLVTFQNFLNVDEANSGVRTMVVELRNIRPGDNAAYPLQVAGDQEIVFFSDIDYDGHAERVRYTLTGTQFVKGVIEPTGFPATYPGANEKVKVVSGNIRNDTTPIFNYYNGDWPADTVSNPLPEPIRLSDTKIMKVYLRLNQKANQSDKDFILESYVQLRMLKQNL
jgi:hypothetical protein